MPFSFDFVAFVRCGRRQANAGSFTEIDVAPSIKSTFSPRDHVVLDVSPSILGLGGDVEVGNR